MLHTIRQVVNDDDFREISAQMTQVFDPYAAALVDVVSIQLVPDHLPLVDLVYDPICVLWLEHLLTSFSAAVKITSSYSSPNLLMNDFANGLMKKARFSSWLS